MLPVTSLEDAIDLANSMAGSSGLLANYNFGNAATVKYLSQYINANASFVNYIPAELLGESPTCLDYKNSHVLRHHFT